jgi:hypothetical protein
MGLQRRNPAAASSESVRRIAGRPHQARQDVLLPRFGGLPAKLGLSGERRRAERGAHCNCSDLVAVYGIINAFPGAGPRTILTPWTPANDPGDPNYANYDLLTCSCTQVVNENSAMLRLDQHFSSKTTGFMRFNYDRSVDTQPLSAAATDLQQKGVHAGQWRARIAAHLQSQPGERIQVRIQSRHLQHLQLQ